MNRSCRSFKKDQPWSNHSRWSFKKIDCDRSALVDLWKDHIALKKLTIPSKKCMFWMFLTVFPLLCQKIKLLLSIFALLIFLKIDGIDLLSSIFEKHRPWSNWSRQTHRSFAYLIWAIWSNERMSDDRMKEYLTLIKYSQKNILFNKWTETAQCSNAPSISAMGIFLRHIKNLRKFDSHCPTVLMKM